MGRARARRSERGERLNFRRTILLSFPSRPRDSFFFFVPRLLLKNFPDLNMGGQGMPASARPNFGRFHLSGQRNITFPRRNTEHSTLLVKTDIEMHKIPRTQRAAAAGRVRESGVERLRERTANTQTRATNCCSSLSSCPFVRPPFTAGEEERDGGVAVGEERLNAPPLPPPPRTTCWGIFSAKNKSLQSRHRRTDGQREGTAVP